MIFLPAVIIAYGTIKSINKTKFVSESYQTEITMAKTVVLDGQSVISKYGKSISLESGMNGEIKDVIDWYGEKHIYQHIRAEFVLSNGDTLYVILNNDIECLDNTITPIIDINNIENSQIVISEFNQTHDLYNHKRAFVRRNINLLNNNILGSNVVQEHGDEVLESVIGLLSRDPIAILSSLVKLRKLTLTIRDAIFLENFQNYLIRLYDIDDAGSINNKCNEKFASLLAEQSPNEEAGYEGDPDRLHENAKRIVKLIDDASTIQKSIYYANLTRAAIDGYINRAQFFKLCNCVRNLTDEDLEYLAIDIQKRWTSTITEDNGLIDDFRAVGLMKEVNEGFSYSKRAFELLKYGLKYEENIQIPNDIQDRMVIGSISEKSIDDLFHVEGETLKLGSVNQKGT